MVLTVLLIVLFVTLSGVNLILMLKRVRVSSGHGEHQHKRTLCLHGHLNEKPVTHLHIMLNEVL